MVVKERFTREEVIQIVTEAKTLEEARERIDCARPKRQKAPPPPEGAISISDAARLCGVSHVAVIKWIRKGLVHVVKITPNWVYVDTETIRKIKKQRENNKLQD